MHTDTKWDSAAGCFLDTFGARKPETYIPGGYKDGPRHQMARMLTEGVPVDQRRQEIGMLWINWLQVIRAWAGEERGRKAELARFLKVTPQRLNHWLNQGKTMPGWAVLMLNKYVNFDDYI